jgi:predicted TIM-barrel fold metal-dependent hydrolase
MSPRAEQLRPYCPRGLVETFDAWHAEQIKGNGYRLPNPYRGVMRRQELNSRTAGHYDMEAALSDMDDDGIAASVVFHGSQNEEPFPFGTTGVVDVRSNLNDVQLTLTGMRMYNTWLADACSIERERHIGLAHIPLWDVELAVREATWARQAGLGGINWPAPKPWASEYDHPVWEPFWSTCEDLGLALYTHSGAVVQGHLAEDQQTATPQSFPLIVIEGAGWPARRGVGRMIFGGAFERHPGLKVILVEQPGVWWYHVLYELDAAWRTGTPELYEIVPRPPSEYCVDQVFVGASFLSHFEAETAIEGGYAANYMWGSDYPHREGTWAFTESPDEASRTRLALHATFTGLDAVMVKGMLGANAVRVLDLDGEALQRVADRINAPAVESLTAPLSIAEQRRIEMYRDRNEDFSMAFREYGE